MARRAFASSSLHFSVALSIVLLSSCNGRFKNGGATKSGNEEAERGGATNHLRPTEPRKDPASEKELKWF